MGHSLGVKTGLLELGSGFGLTRIWRLLNPWAVPVLALHGVLPEEQARLFNATGKFMSPERLKRLVERISRNYVFVSMGALIDGLLSGRPPRRSIVLTFDDGYANAFSLALPLLRRMGVPFSVFVTTGYVGTDRVLWNDLLEFAVFSTRERSLRAGVLERDMPLGTGHERSRAVVELKPALKRLPLEEARDKVMAICASLGVNVEGPELEHVRFLTSDQITAMAEGGVQFGGHTVTHPILSRETRGRVHTEVSVCKERLEALTCRPVRCFAYPNGQRTDFNEMVKREVREAGYEAAFSAIPGLNRSGDDLFEIKRLAVDCRWSYEELDTRVSGLIEVLRR